VLASDFAIGRFHFLSRLLLVHGHWCYYRLGTMVLYNFYKNAVFVFQLFWFTFYNGFSTQSAIDQLNLLLFSLAFTSVPTIMYGIFEQDVSARTLSTIPQLYAQGREGLVYRRPKFVWLMLDTLWQSIVSFFVPLGIYRPDGTLWYGVTCCMPCPTTW